MSRPGIKGYHVLLSTIIRTWYPLIPGLAMNFPVHIHQFYFLFVKGIIRIVFFYILVLSCISCQIFDQSFGLIVLLWIMSEFSDDLSDFFAIYTSKVVVVCFNLCLFTDYHEVIFPSQILLSQIFTIIIISPSFIEIFYYLFLEYFSR